MRTEVGSLSGEWRLWVCLHRSLLSAHALSSATPFVISSIRRDRRRPSSRGVLHCTRKLPALRPRRLRTVSRSSSDWCGNVGPGVPRVRSGARSARRRQAFTPRPAARARAPARRRTRAADRGANSTHPVIAGAARHRHRRRHRVSRAGLRRRRLARHRRPRGRRAAGRPTRCASRRSSRARSTLPPTASIVHGALHPRDVLLSPDETAPDRPRHRARARTRRRRRRRSAGRTPRPSASAAARGIGARTSSASRPSLRAAVGPPLSGTGAQAVEGITEAHGGASAGAARCVRARARRRHGRSVRHRAGIFRSARRSLRRPACQGQPHGAAEHGTAARCRAAVAARTEPSPLSWRCARPSRARISASDAEVEAVLQNAARDGCAG